MKQMYLIFLKLDHMDNGVQNGRLLTSEDRKTSVLTYLYIAAKMEHTLMNRRSRMFDCTSQLFDYSAPVN